MLVLLVRSVSAVELRKVWPFSRSRQFVPMTMLRKMTSCLLGRGAGFCRIYWDVVEDSFVSLVTLRIMDSFVSLVTLRIIYSFVSLVTLRIKDSFVSEGTLLIQDSFVSLVTCCE